jgi:hypothetical protein
LKKKARAQGRTAGDGSYGPQELSLHSLPDVVGSGHPLTSLSRLTDLDASWCRHLSPEVIQSLGPHLRRLSVRGLSRSHSLLGPSRCPAPRSPWALKALCSRNPLGPSLCPAPATSWALPVPRSRNLLGRSQCPAPADPLGPSRWPAPPTPWGPPGAPLPQPVARTPFLVRGPGVGKPFPHGRVFENPPESLGLRLGNPFWGPFVCGKPFLVPGPVAGKPLLRPSVFVWETLLSPICVWKTLFGPWACGWETLAEAFCFCLGNPFKPLRLCVKSSNRFLDLWLGNPFSDLSPVFGNPCPIHLGVCSKTLPILGPALGKPFLEPSVSVSTPFRSLGMWPGNPFLACLPVLELL